MKGYAPVLIVAKPGRVRDGLQALLAAISQTEIVGPADDGPSALRMITEHHPVLVLLDADLPDDGAPTVLGRIKSEWPQIRCIVLADNVRQQQAAQAAGADSVLIKGFPAAQLFATIKRLIPRHETTEKRAKEVIG